jgi:hypothetical protein
MLIAIDYCKSKIVAACYPAQYPTAKFDEFWIYFTKTWVDYYKTSGWNVHELFLKYQAGKREGPQS